MNESSNADQSSFDGGDKHSYSPNLPSYGFESNSNSIAVMAYPAQGDDELVQISYSGGTEMIGCGGHGNVYLAELCKTGEKVAIKKLKNDPLFGSFQYAHATNDKTKNDVKAMVELSRELKILREVKHCNIANLKWFFLDPKNSLNFVLEYMPMNLRQAISLHKDNNDQSNFVLGGMPMNLAQAISFHKDNNNQSKALNTCYIKLYMYQLFRSLAFIHSLSICHRSIKPENILVNPESGVLKLCDFGNSKYLQCGEQNQPQMCALQYRAPELLFNSRNYTTKIDIWSAGCILAELLMGYNIFNSWSDHEVDQIIGIIGILGTPTREDLLEMTDSIPEKEFPKVVMAWTRVFHEISITPEAIDLLSLLWRFKPSSRISPLQACAQPFFDELRDSKTRLPNGSDLPPLFNFTEYELSLEPELNKKLFARHLL